jgi:hypothetical protein
MSISLLMHFIRDGKCAIKNENQRAVKHRKDGDAVKEKPSEVYY